MTVSEGMTAPIPDKLYFRIGEVCRLTRLKPSVLRFWETEFPMLKPVKSGAGQRLYRRADIELIQEIQRFLYSEKLTIAGTRKRLSRREAALPAGELAEIVREIRTELLELRKMLT